MRCTSRSFDPRHLTPGVAYREVFCSSEVVRSCDVCMMWSTFFHILSTLSWPKPKIITRLLSKTICMPHGGKIVIKVRVLEATQTAEPILHILPLCPCVSKHSERHLAPKDRKAFHALRRPVLSSRSFPLRMS